MSPFLPRLLQFGRKIRYTIRYTVFRRPPSESWHVCGLLGVILQGGSLAIPGNCYLVVLRRALTVCVPLSQFILRICISLIGGIVAELGVTLKKAGRNSRTKSPALSVLAANIAGILSSARLGHTMLPTGNCIMLSRATKEEDNNCQLCVQLDSCSEGVSIWASGSWTGTTTTFWQPGHLSFLPAR